MKIVWRVMEVVTWIVAVLLVLGVGNIAPDGTPRWGELVSALLLLIALVAYQIRDEAREHYSRFENPDSDCGCEDCNEDTPPRNLVSS